MPARPTRPAFGTGLTLQREPAHATHCWRATGHSSCCRGSTFLVVAVRIVHCRARVGVLGTGLPMRGRGQASPLRCCRQVAHVWPVATPKRGCSARLLRNLDRKPQRLVPALAAVESADCACVDCSSIATCAARASAFAGASRVASGEDLALDARGRAEPVQHVPSRRGAGRRLVHAVRVVGLAQDAVPRLAEVKYALAIAGRVVHVGAFAALADALLLRRPKAGERLVLQRARICARRTPQPWCV